MKGEGIYYCLRDPGTRRPVLFPPLAPGPCIDKGISPVKVTTTFVNRPRVFRYFVESGAPFQIRSTSFSQVFKSVNGNKVMLSDSAYGFKALGLISKIRAEGKRALARTGGIVPERSLLYSAKETGSMEETAIFEYDKTAAYTNAARALGVISQATYDALLLMPKGIRLKLLGSLGTVSTVQTYERGLLVKTESVHAVTRPLWFLISNSVSDEMLRHYFLHSSVFAFWVDALYSFEEMKHLEAQGFRQKKIQATLVQQNGLRMYVNNSQHLFIPARRVSTWQ